MTELTKLKMNPKPSNGSAYELREAAFDENLALTGKGTPSGEFLRRYWHPLTMSSKVRDLPVRVRALSEDMVLFRKPSGELGLIHPRCAHRGADMFFGSIDEGGIRCPYHGWQFDPKGHCLDQPCEVNGGGKGCEKVRQPWYPVQERYGIVFGYLGPLDKMPLLPRYDVLEELTDEFEILVDDSSAPTGGPDRFHCNWFQTHENTFDMAHTFWLHRAQFPRKLAESALGEYETHDRGIAGSFPTELPGGGVVNFKTEVIWPTLRLVPHPLLLTPGPVRSIDWTLPVDDTETRVFSAIITRKGEVTPYAEGQVWGPFALYGEDGSKTWFELDEQGHQRWPADYEAQVGQGPIHLHSDEQLVQSDRGIVMLRRLYKEAVQRVANGEDAPGTAPEDELVKVRAGIYLHAPTSESAPA
ncbi:MAG: Rieske 2Fe-2S domain-containing protein [Pseudomonas sp.]